MQPVEASEMSSDDDDDVTVPVASAVGGALGLLAAVYCALTQRKKQKRKHTLEWVNSSLSRSRLDVDGGIQMSQQGLMANPMIIHEQQELQHRVEMVENQMVTQAQELDVQVLEPTQVQTAEPMKVPPAIPHLATLGGNPPKEEDGYETVSEAPTPSGDGRGIAQSLELPQGPDAANMDEEMNSLLSARSQPERATGEEDEGSIRSFPSARSLSDDGS